MGTYVFLKVFLCLIITSIKSVVKEIRGMIDFHAYFILSNSNLFFLWLIRNTGFFTARFRPPVIPPSLSQQGPDNVLSPQQCLTVYLLPFPRVSYPRSHLFKAQRGQCSSA